MKLCLLGAAVLAATASLLGAQTAQTAQTSLFRAVMPVNNGNSAVADILVHAVKDSSGNILSGSLDVNIAYEFAGDETVSGFSVSGGPTGVSTLGPQVQVAAGRGQLTDQIQVPANMPAALSILSDLLSDPSPYSVTLSFANEPGGALTGNVQAANSATLMAVLSSSAGSGTATVTVTYTGPAYAITSAAVAMQVAYDLPAQATFSGLRIYAGPGGTGSIAVAADILPGTLASSTGSGTLTVPATQIDIAGSAMAEAVQSLLASPTSFSIALDLVENPSAPLAGQLRAADSMTFQIPGFAGSGAASEIILHTLRQASGSIVAGDVVFDVNYRLAANAAITQIDIDGAIVIPSVAGNSSGAGNTWVAIPVGSAAGLSSLNGIVSNPAAHKIDLVTTTTLSAPLAATPGGPPAVAAVIPIVEVKTLSTFAPGELVEIYGTNLAQATTDLTAWPGGSLPTQLNGVSVSIGSQTARLLYVSPNQVDAAFPFETPFGSQPLVLSNGTGVSAPFDLTVAAVAPALYNFAFENAGFSLVSQGNPASAGDVLVFYATGLGQTTAPLASGQTVPTGPPYFNTPTVTVTIGGANAPVIYSIAAPPYVAGLYQFAVTVPAGLTPGNQSVVAASGGLQSNAVTIVTK